MKKKFKIEKIKEDLHLKQVASKINVCLNTVSVLARKYNLGYKRDGAGNFRYLKDFEVELIKEYFQIKKEYYQKIKESEEKVKKEYCQKIKEWEEKVKKTSY